MYRQHTSIPTTEAVFSQLRSRLAPFDMLSQLPSCDKFLINSLLNVSSKRFIPENKDCFSKYWKPHHLECWATMESGPKYQCYWRFLTSNIQNSCIPWVYSLIISICGRCAVSEQGEDSLTKPLRKVEMYILSCDMDGGVACREGRGILLPCVPRTKRR